MSRRQACASATNSPMPGWIVMSGAPQWTVGVRVEPNRRKCQSQRRSALAAQPEHRLLAEQIPRPPWQIDLQRVAGIVEREASFDARADFVRQNDEIANRAKMNVRGVVPGVAEIFGHRHAALERDLRTNP